MLDCVINVPFRDYDFIAAIAEATLDHPSPTVGAWFLSRAFDLALTACIAAGMQSVSCSLQEIDVGIEFLTAYALAVLRAFVVDTSCISPPTSMSRLILVRWRVEDVECSVILAGWGERGFLFICRCPARHACSRRSNRLWLIFAPQTGHTLLDIDAFQFNE